MEITNFVGGQRYLTDINWEPRVAKSNVKSLFETVSKEKGARFGLVHHFNGYATVGVLATDGKATKPKLPSAAITLSIANSKEYDPEGEKGLGWVFVQRVEGNRYWVGAAYNGHPYLRDTTVPVEDVRSTVGELISDIRAVDSDAAISTFVSEEDVFMVLSNAFATFEGVSVSRRDFEDLASEVKYKVEIKKQASVGGIIGLLALFVALGVAGYFAYEWWEETQEKERARLREEGRLRNAEAVREMQRKYEQDKLEAIKKAKENAITEINERLSIQNKSEVLREWVKTINKEPIELPGWVVREFRCTIDEDKPVCDYRIERRKEGNVGTVKRLYEHYDATGIEFDRKGDEAKVRRGGGVVLPKSTGDYRLLDGFKRIQFQLDTLSKIQLFEILGIERTFNIPVPVSYAVSLPTPPQGIVQQTTVPKEGGGIEPFQIRVGIEEGSFKINGSGQYQLLGLAERFSEIEKPLKITRLRFMPGDVEDWEVEGIYYYQSDVDSNIDTIENEIPKSTIQETNRK